MATIQERLKHAILQRVTELLQVNIVAQLTCSRLSLRAFKVPPTTIALSPLRARLQLLCWHQGLKGQVQMPKRLPLRAGHHEHKPSHLAPAPERDRINQENKKLEVKRAAEEAHRKEEEQQKRDAKASAFSAKPWLAGRVVEVASGGPRRSQSFGEQASCQLI